MPGRTAVLTVVATVAQAPMTADPTVARTATAERTVARTAVPVRST
jgi:hypothetical protein